VSTELTAERERPLGSELVAPIHNRMPVILPREAWAAWLGEEPADKDALLALLKPLPAERMRAYPVSTKVNSVTNDEPSLPAWLARELGIPRTHGPAGRRRHAARRLRELGLTGLRRREYVRRWASPSDGSPLLLDSLAPPARRGFSFW
jgi:hypothetical protein